jgi:transposase
LPTTKDGYRALRQVARQWPDRIWAIEGASGTGRPLAQRLLADGERVLDVPAKLAARARVFDTGQGRKTDATDAHAVVMVALRDAGLRELAVDDELVVLRMLCDRRDELSKAKAQGLNRMHRLLADLVPGGVSTKKSVAQYRAMLAAVRPRDQLGRTRRRLAADLLADLVQVEARLKALKAELKQAVLARRSGLMDIYGVGPAGAARILADVGDITRFGGPQPLRFLDRHRPDRRLVRRADPAPALPGREPAAQSRALHGRVRPAAPRHRRPGLLPA